MSDQRIQFIKTGRARYISHLDLMRTFQRAFLRSGLHVKHSPCRWVFPASVRSWSSASPRGPT